MDERLPIPASIGFRGAPDQLDQRAMALTAGAPIRKGSERNEREVLNVRNLLLIGGAACLSVVVLFHLFDAISMLNDPTFVFFVGRLWPRRIILLCCLVLLIYALLVVFFYKRTPGEGRTDVSFFMIVSITVSILGLSLVAISLSLRASTEAAKEDLFFNCQGGASTQRLYEEAVQLQGLRSLPECQSKFSVTECNGYEESSPYTDMLKYMEQHYKCAGFCYSNASTPIAQLSMLEQRKGRTLLGSLERFVATHKLSPTAHSALLQAGQEEVSSGAALSVESLNDEPGRTTFYPPALFSNFQYQTSCDGMASRDLQYQGVHVATTLYWSGCWLLLTITLAGFIGLCNFSSPSPRSSKSFSRR
jgi:hypothetical protein